MLKKIFVIAFFGSALLLAGASIAFRLSPWPSALLIRLTFDRGAVEANEALAKHLPAAGGARLDERYDPADGDAYVDVYYPASVENTEAVLPTVVWIHGGAWISGDKSQIGNYLRILASRGFTTVSVGYSIAPGAKYPTPLRQANAALAYLTKNSARLHIDPDRLFLAGDSAGAQIAGQLANLISAPGYARKIGIPAAIERRQLRGIILHCGVYEPSKANFEGDFGGFLRTVLWSYLGTRDFLNDPRLAELSVVKNMTADFPPIFISAGNADPLEPQSQLVVEAALRLGVPVDGLFFPKDHQPPLPHEYQFTLDNDAGRLALERSAVFLAARSAP
jgi:acetyl esterase/lipase